jgi:hypothetical protein
MESVDQLTPEQLAAQVKITEAAEAAKLQAEKERKALEKSNSTRLAMFNSEMSRQKQSRFKVVTRHAAIESNDSCAVVGTLDYKAYSRGYVSRNSADEATGKLNEQYFD